MPDLVIFDCDGVLVDSEVLAVEAFCEVLAAAGVPAQPAMIARCFGMKQVDILRSVERDAGVPVPASVADALWPATRALFDRGLRPMPGVARFLARLGDSPRCVASSSSLERIRFSLAKTGLDGFFGGHVFSSQMVACGKPAPDLFLFAAGRRHARPGLPRRRPHHARPRGAAAGRRRRGGGRHIRRGRRTSVSRVRRAAAGEAHRQLHRFVLIAVQMFISLTAQKDTGGSR